MFKARVKKVVSIGLHIIASLLSYIVPKKKGYWVFVSFQFYGKYSGNTKALFEYIHANKKQLNIGEKEIVYVTNTSQTERVIRKSGLPVIYNRLFWLLPLLRAEMIFTDGARSFMGFGNYKYVQLWHGTGYKNIGLSYSGKKYTYIRHFLLRRFFSKMVLVCATSEHDRQRKEKAFSSSKVVITGSPRNDIFFNQQSIRSADGVKRFLYAPTFRDTGNMFNAMSLGEWEKMDILMQKVGGVFLVKRHPSDYKLKVPDKFENIIDITEDTEDIQELLASVDVLITDYSGITSDFVITGKPVIFYTYDFEDYMKKNRTFYYDIKKILPGPFVQSGDELIECLEDFSWFENLEYQLRYQKFRSMFHTYMDGDSSRRFFDEVLKITI